MNKETLLVFTHSYPYGNGEQFLELELKILSPFYKEIVLVPTSIDSKVRKLPADNVSVLINNQKYIPKKNWQLFYLILKILVFEILQSKFRLIYLKKLRYYISYLKNSIIQSSIILNTIIQKYPNSICYTYWFSETTFHLSILKFQHKIIKLITRGHGGDIYEYQHPEKDYIFPFRNFQMKHIDAVFAVSADGSMHLKSDYKKFDKKIKVSYLACEQFTTSQLKNTNQFTLVSCSTFYSYKRIPFLIETLIQCKSTLHWIHIGDTGDEKEQSQRLLNNLPNNITYEWKGFLSKNELQKFYNTTRVNLFINVSSSEGLPVTLMEAISCGIPIMATDTGGVREIANPEIGILLDKKINKINLSQKIDAIVNGDILLPSKQKIIQFWEHNFSDKNYIQFYNDIQCVA